MAPPDYVLETPQGTIIGEIDIRFNQEARDVYPSIASNPEGFGLDLNSLPIADWPS